MIKQIFLYVLQFVSLALAAQKSRPPMNEGLNELARLGDMYKHLPLQLHIKLRNSATPITSAADTMQTAMELYIAPHMFYMQSEGLEEIINDSLVVLVNNTVKEMQLFRSDSSLTSRFQQIGSLQMPASSTMGIEKKFSITFTREDGNINKIELTSKNKVPGTEFPTELLHIASSSDNHELIEYSQHKNRLIPIEDSVYFILKEGNAFAGRLMHSTGPKGDMYFLIKENVTTYRFVKVRHNVADSPVAIIERIIKSKDETYLPAKGFEEYSVKQQF